MCAKSVLIEVRDNGQIQLKKVTVAARGRPKSFTIFILGGVVSTRKPAADGRNGQDGR
jgi:hypothetical protein